MNSKYFSKCIYGKLLGLKIQLNMKIPTISLIRKLITIHLPEYQGTSFNILNFLINCTLIYFDSHNTAACLHTQSLIHENPNTSLYKNLLHNCAYL